MIKNFALMLACLPLLTACPDPVRPDPSVVTQTIYIVRQAPDDMYKLPPPVVNIDAETATQRDLALWITNSEDRTLELERMLHALQLYFNAPVAPSEKPAN